MKLAFNNYMSPGLVLLLVLPVACVQGPAKQELAGVWVSTPLAQCWSSPWQQAWRSNPANEGTTYPKGLPEEYAIINDYFAAENIVVSDSKITSETIIACAACGCPNGETMYLYIRQQDVETMLANGFTLATPEQK